MSAIHDHASHSHAWETLSAWLGADRYSEHSICLTNDPLIILVYVASDLTIFLAYFTMGIALVLRRQVIALLSPDALALYGAFIFLCGLSHLTEVVTMFSGVYRLDVAISALTAGVSAVTAAYTAMSLWQVRYEQP